MRAPYAEIPGLVCSLHQLLTPAQISLAWMLGKHPWIVPIPGTRNAGRLRENATATELDLTRGELDRLDQALDALPTPLVFGGSAQIR